MFVLGIQGSPRKNGNSNYLLSSFLKECESFGAKTREIYTPDLKIAPCKELIVCEKKGFCPLKDEMETLGYEAVKAADVVVLASPVFFYGVSAQAKIFIDRCQMFWGRKYKLGLKDPDRFTRQGFLLSVAASAGKRLFEGVDLTAKYFFDAISADYSGSLTYKKVEDAGDIIVRPELDQEIKDAVSHLLNPLKNSKKVLFISPGGQCRSPMAAAFVKEISRGRVRSAAAGLEPPERPDEQMLRIMADQKIDLKYQPAHELETLKKEQAEWADADRIIFLGTGSEFESSRELPKDVIFWETPVPEELPPEAYAQLRDGISDRIKRLLSGI